MINAKRSFIIAIIMFFRQRKFRLREKIIVISEIQIGSIDNIDLLEVSYRHSDRSSNERFREMVIYCIKISLANVARFIERI